MSVKDVSFLRDRNRASGKQLSQGSSVVVLPRHAQRKTCSSFGDLPIFGSLSARNFKNLFLIGMSIHLSHVHLKVLGLEPPTRTTLS